MGVADAAANLLCVFRIAEKKEDKLTKSKNGKVILVSDMARSNFSGLPLKPGAITVTNNGIKISIRNTIVSNEIMRIFKTLFANFSPTFFPLLSSVL